MTETSPSALEREYLAALAHHRAGDYREAVAGFRRAIAINPLVAEPYYNIGLDLYELGALEPAVAAYRAAIALKPDFYKALNNLGTTLMRLDRTTEAETAFRRAIAIRPEVPEPHVNLGEALVDLGRLDEAIAVHRHAVSLAPDNPDAANDLGSALALMNRCEEALGSYAKAIRLSPDYDRPRVNYAMTLLKLGRLKEGWTAYEWRWKRHPEAERWSFRQPEWDGAPLKGRTLLLYGEQGFGDSLQFVRYLPLMAPGDGKIILRVPAPLVRLFQNVAGADRVIANTSPLPGFDCHLSLMSLPRLAGTEMDSIPADIPYLFPDKERASGWEKRLDALPGVKVGLVWAGNPRTHDIDTLRVDRRRSLPPEAFAGLSGIPGLVLISLQKTNPGNPPPPSLRLVNWMKEIADFADTAALIAGLDLVITVDTAVAHLAGALGKPVWILSRFDGCWRWFLNRDDTPWYPTARLFRQTRYGDWSGPLSEMEREAARLPAIKKELKTG